jgi:coenzyme F420-reducing hydrogenase delta subunit
VTYAKKLLAEVGLEPERLEMFFLSSAEGAHFAEIATEMTERARRLGPNPLKRGRTPPEFSATDMEV